MSCPICSNETDPKYRPFCSGRCADIDLGKWMTDQYVVPGSGEDDAEELMEEMEQALEEQGKKLH